MGIFNIIRTSNNKFGRTIWDKLPECIFEKFEIARVKLPKITRTKHVITNFNHIKPTNTYIETNPDIS